MIFLENLHSKVTEHGYTLKIKKKVINQKIRTYIKDVGEMPDEAYTRRQTDEKTVDRRERPTIVHQKLDTRRSIRLPRSSQRRAILSSQAQAPRRTVL